MDRNLELGGRRRNEKARLIWFLVASLVIITVAGLVVANFGTIKDIVIGMRYKPTAEMEAIRGSLGLTGRGYRIFNASMPELKERAEFNQNCREVANEAAILGCYTDEKIYIYNIVSEELPGIRELATAHELLHAVYDRMSISERAAWDEMLWTVYTENKEILGEEIDLYPEEQKKEEIYVRVGTEVKNLPDALEKHYAEIFENQDAVVKYYESHITVFREIEEKLEVLLGKINTLKAEIDERTDAYETGAENLNVKISEFNECAQTVNCFSSSADFNSRRAGLISEQDGLLTIYNKINELISQYNKLIEEYNENVLHGQQLNMTINSSAKVERVE